MGVTAISYKGISFLSFKKNRFEIEDVPEDSSHLNNPTSPTENPNVTISSLGYNTTEAVPMTMYYRKAGEGNTRPTLDYLRQGRTNPPPEPEQNVVCSLRRVLKWAGCFS